MESKGTLSVSLPAAFCQKHGLKQGDLLSIYYGGHPALLIVPEGSPISTDDLVTKRKAQLYDKTLYLSLPKNWCQKHNVRGRSALRVELVSDGRALLYSV